MMYDQDPRDAPDVRILRQSFHTTRSDRLCSCGRIIPAGARYERVSGTEDGYWFSDVYCAGRDPNEPCPYPFHRDGDRFIPLGADEQNTADD